MNFSSYYMGIRADIRPEFIFEEVLANFIRFKCRGLRLDTAVDIGAHFGSFSLLAAHDGCQRVIAFEPRWADELTAHLKENHFLSRVKIKNAAVMKEPANAVCLTSVDPDGNKGLTGPFYSKGEKVGVPAVAFCDVLASEAFIDYLKVDVEGAEFNFFVPSPGFLHLMNARVGFLDLEIHYEQVKGFHSVDFENPLIDPYWRIPPDEITPKIMELIRKMHFEVIHQERDHILAVGENARRL